MKSTFMHSNVYFKYFLLSNVLKIQTLKHLQSLKHFELHHVSSCIVKENVFLVKTKTLQDKTVVEKCKAIKDSERGMTNKDVAEKYVVPKNN